MTTVDRSRRDRFAQLLRHFAAGRITNDDYVDSGARIYIPSLDPTMRELWKQTWFWYDDAREHRMVGVHALPHEHRRLVARMIVFLYSDLPYEWPVRSWKLAFVLGVLTFGGWHRWFPVPANDGDTSVWPFFRAADFEQARGRPRLLGGRR